MTQHEQVARQAFQQRLDGLVKLAVDGLATEDSSAETKQVLKNLLAIGLASAAGAGAGFGVRHLLRRAAVHDVETGGRTLLRFLPVLGGVGGAGIGALYGIARSLRDQESARLQARAAAPPKVATFHVPHSTCPTKIEPPKKKRKKWPFQGYLIFQGLEIDVENKRGSTRHGVDGDGKRWSTYMHHHYGEIRGTEGADGEDLDCYVGPNQDSPLVVVVHQQDPKTKKYDEDKVMLGFDNEAAAVAAYKRQYDRPDYYQSHVAMPIGRFWRWVHDERKQGKKVAARQLLLGGSQ